MTKIACLLLGLMLSVPLAAQKTYYMDPEGEDTNPGTESKPFATIMKVQEVVAAGVFDTLKSMLPPPFLLYFSTTRYNTPRLELYSNSTAFFKNLPK